jgi:hypothetical protein
VDFFEMITITKADLISTMTPTWNNRCYMRLFVKSRTQTNTLLFKQVSLQVHTQVAIQLMSQVRAELEDQLLDYVRDQIQENLQ